MRAATWTSLVMSQSIIWVAKWSPNYYFGSMRLMDVSMIWFYWHVLTEKQLYVVLGKQCSNFDASSLHAGQGMGQGTWHQWSKIWKFKFLLSQLAYYLPFSGDFAFNYSGGEFLCGYCCCCYCFIFLIKRTLRSLL